MKTLWITALFFPLVSVCLWVEVSCVYTLSLVILQFDLVECGKMQFYLNGHLEIQSLHQKIRAESMAKVVLWFLILLYCLSKTPPLHSRSHCVPERARRGGLAGTPQPPPLSCILSLWLQQTLHLSSASVEWCHCVHVKQRISMKREKSYWHFHFHREEFGFTSFC